MNNEKEESDFTKYEDFDFTRSSTDRRTLKVKKSQFVKFLKVGAASLLASSLIVGSAYSVYNLYDNHINNTVKEAEALIVKMGNPTLIQLKNIGFRNNNLYSKNKELLANLEKDQALLKAMKVPIDIPTLKNENESKFQQAEGQLRQDLYSTEKIVSLGSSHPTEKQKREILYYNTQDFENFKNASSNNLVNQQGLANINANLQKQSTFLKEAKIEILKTIKDKLNNGDFNFASKKKEYEMKLAENLHQERSEIALIKSELEKDSDLKSEVNPQEIAESEKNINEIEALAEDQILQDEKLVNEMVKVLEEQGVKVDESQAVQAAPTVTTATTTSPTVIHSHSSGGFNFMHYYLLSQWMSSSPKTTITNNITNQYSAGPTSSLSAMGAQQAPSYNGSMRAGLVNSNPYDFREAGSHLNQTMAAKGLATHHSTNFHQVHQNIIKAQTRISSYRSAKISTRSSSVGRSISARGSSGG
jgi:hypothetical protein